MKISIKPHGYNDLPIFIIIKPTNERIKKTESLGNHDKNPFLNNETTECLKKLLRFQLCRIFIFLKCL